jgi:hypothetical protein
MSWRERERKTFTRINSLLVAMNESSFLNGSVVYMVTGTIPIGADRGTQEREAEKTSWNNRS